MSGLLDAFTTGLAAAPAGRNTSVNHTYAKGDVTDEQIVALLEANGCVARPEVVAKARSKGNPMAGDWQGKGVGATLYDSGKLVTRGAAIS